jgi:hypothetical protein
MWELIYTDTQTDRQTVKLSPLSDSGIISHSVGARIPSPNKVVNNVHPAPRVPNVMPIPRVSSPLPTITKAIINKPIFTTQSIPKPIKQGRNHHLSNQSYNKKSMKPIITEPESHSKLTCKFNIRNILNMLSLFATTKRESTLIIGN